MPVQRSTLRSEVEVTFAGIKVNTRKQVILAMRRLMIRNSLRQSCPPCLATNNEGVV
jgi:hypothetical protein